MSKETHAIKTHDLQSLNHFQDEEPTLHAISKHPLLKNAPNHVLVLLAGALATISNVKAAVTVVSAPHDTSSILSAYDTLGTHSNYTITISGTTAEGIQSIQQINFALPSSFGAPGVDSGMFDGNLTVTQNGIVLGQLGLNSNDLDPTIIESASGSPIYTNGQDFTLEFSDDPLHTISNIGITVADPNAPGTEDIAWSVEGIDGTIAFEGIGINVPETSTAVMLALGAAGLVGSRRRKQEVPK